MSNRYLTKSRFKLAMECPTKLYYTNKEEYINQNIEDSFLIALAEGGFQVGELAKHYFAGGYDIESLDYYEALRITNELLMRENVIIYEAAIKYENFFIRTDILIKKGRNIELIEVKAKSADDFYNTNGIKPAWMPYLLDHIDGWSKWYLGFVDPVEIKENQPITLNPVSDEPELYKIVVPGSGGKEYFLLENRQQNSFDGGLAYSDGGKDLHGLLIYHVVDDMIQKEFYRPNEAENWDNNHLGKGPRAYSEYGQTHYGFSIIQADGMYDLEKGNNDGDAGDVFPGIYNITSLSSKSNKGPNTASVIKWSKGNNETGINLNNIAESEDGTITLEVVFTK